jgi:putative PIN family toxin of toxin-antitoxin system
MVYLQAAANATGPAAACMRIVEIGLVELFTSKEILEEVQDVLARPKIRRKFPRLTDEVVESFLARVQKTAAVIDQVPCAISFQRDPKDEKYLNLAAFTGAMFLVSRDNDLLDLMRNDQPASQELRAIAPNLIILDPVRFLQQVEPPKTAEAPANS